MNKPIVKLEEFLRVVGEVFPNLSVHEGEKHYDDCLSHREIWDNLDNVNREHVQNIVVPFLNKWRCRLPYECVPGLTATLQRAERWLQPLRGLNIEDVDLLEPVKIKDEEIRTFILVENVFNAIQKVRARRRTVAFTATSKILHMAIPNFFVMCDESIRKEYGCEGNGAGYANFMLRMSLFAHDLILQAHGNRQRILDCSKWKGRTLARLLDIYNYTKFTLNKPNWG